jgi:hypothetical protein
MSVIMPIEQSQIEDPHEAGNERAGPPKFTKIVDKMMKGNLDLVWDITVIPHDPGHLSPKKYVKLEEINCKGILEAMEE